MRKIAIYLAFLVILFFGAINAFAASVSVLVPSEVSVGQEFTGSFSCSKSFPEEFVHSCSIISFGCGYNEISKSQLSGSFKAKCNTSGLYTYEAQVTYVYVDPIVKKKKTKTDFSSSTIKVTTPSLKQCLSQKCGGSIQSGDTNYCPEKEGYGNYKCTDGNWECNPTAVFFKGNNWQWICPEGKWKLVQKCTSNEAECKANQLVKCNPDGTAWETTLCSYGCLQNKCNVPLTLQPSLPFLQPQVQKVELQSNSLPNNIQKIVSDLQKGSFEEKKLAAENIKKISISLLSRQELSKPKEANLPESFYVDINKDGTVNLDDLVLAADNFGRSGTGDVDKNNIIDIFDLSAIAKNLNIDVVLQLIDLYNSSQSKYNEQAEFLKAMGEISSDRVIPVFIEALKISNSSLPYIAYRALIKKGLSAVEPVIQTLNDRTISGYGISIIVKIGEKNGEPVIHKLINALEREDAPQLETALSSIFVSLERFAVKPLMQALSDSSSYVRRVAADRLGIMKSGEAVWPLIVALKDIDSRVRAAAVRSLEYIQDVSAVNELRKVLKDPDVSVRAAAAHAVGVFQDEKSLEQLKNLLSDSDWEVRNNAAWSLGQIGGKRAANLLIQELKNLNPLGPPSLFPEALLTIGKNAVDELIEALNNEDLWTRYYAIFLLGQIGEKKALDFLVPIIKKDDDLLKAAVIRSLGLIGDKTQDKKVKERVIDQLISLIDKKDILVIYNMKFTYAQAVTGVLADMSKNPDNKELLRRAVPALIKAVQEDYFIAIEALENIGDKNITGVLIDILKDKTKDEQMRARVVTALGNIGEVDTLPVLKEFLMDKSVVVQTEIIRVLGRMKDKSSVDALIQLLFSPDSNISGEAAMALGEIGDLKAIEPIMDKMRSFGAQEKDPRIGTLVKIGNPSVDILIEELKKGKFSDITSAVIWALGEIKNERAIPLLIAGLSDKFQRNDAVKALSKIGRPAQKELIKMLDNEDWVIRSIVINLLGIIGDSDAVKALREMIVKENDWVVMDAIMDALEKIRIFSRYSTYRAVIDEFGITQYPTETKKVMPIIESQINFNMSKTLGKPVTPKSTREISEAGKSQKKKRDPLQSAIERKKMMKQLARENPREFLRKALPKKIRDQMGKNIQQHFEEEVTIKDASWAVVHLDNFENKSSQEQYLIQKVKREGFLGLFGEKKLEEYGVNIVGTVPSTLSGSKVNVTGWKIDDQIVVNQENVQYTEPSKEEYQEYLQQDNISQIINKLFLISDRFLLSIATIKEALIVQKDEFDAIELIPGPKKNLKDSLGEQRMAVILLKGKGSNNLPSSEKVRDLINEDIFGERSKSGSAYTVQDFFEESSYDKMRLKGAVYGVYDFGDLTYADMKDNSMESMQSIESKVIKSADSDINFNQYDRIMLVLIIGEEFRKGPEGKSSFGKKIISTQEGFIEASVGVVSMTTKRFSGQGESSFPSLTFVHEYTHGLNIGHANGIYCKDEVLPTDTSGIIDLGLDCKNVEYGNGFDVMGTSLHSTHHNGYFKELLGWISEKDGSVIKIEKPGIYALKPLEEKNAIVAKISRAVHHNPFGSNPNFDYVYPADYYMEYRQPIGADIRLDSKLDADSKFKLDSKVASGILINLHPKILINSSGNFYSYLLNMDPLQTQEVSGFIFPVSPSLMPGQSFVDKSAGIKVTNLKEDSLKKELTFAVDFCDLRRPFVNIYPLEADYGNVFKLGDFDKGLVKKKVDFVIENQSECFIRKYSLNGVANDVGSLLKISNIKILPSEVELHPRETKIISATFEVSLKDKDLIGIEKKHFRPSMFPLIATLSMNVEEGNDREDKKTKEYHIYLVESTSEVGNDLEPASINVRRITPQGSNVLEDLIFKSGDKIVFRSGVKNNSRDPRTSSSSFFTKWNIKDLNDNEYFSSQLMKHPGLQAGENMSNVNEDVVKVDLNTVPNLFKKEMIKEIESIDASLLEWEVPSDIPLGKYKITYRIDAKNQVTEFNELNNIIERYFFVDRETIFSHESSKAIRPEEKEQTIGKEINLISPAHELKELPYSKVKLQWSALLAKKAYHKIYLCEKSHVNCASAEKIAELPVAHIDTTTSTSFEVFNLKPSTTYRWDVQVFTDENKLVDSSNGPFEFTTRKFAEEPTKVILPPPRLPQFRRP